MFSGHSRHSETRADEALKSSLLSLEETLTFSIYPPALKELNIITFRLYVALSNGRSKKILSFHLGETTQVCLVTQKKVQWCYCQVSIHRTGFIPHTNMDLLLGVHPMLRMTPQYCKS